MSVITTKDPYAIVGTVLRSTRNKHTSSSLARLGLSSTAGPAGGGSPNEPQTL